MTLLRESALDTDPLQLHHAFSRDSARPFRLGRTQRHRRPLFSTRRRTENGVLMSTSSLEHVSSNFLRNVGLMLTTFRNSGIGVDVHVDRITNRLGWHKPPTLGHPEKTRRVDAFKPVGLVLTSA